MLRVVAKISLSSRLDFPRVPHIVLQHSRPTSPPSSIGSPTSSQLRSKALPPACQVTQRAGAAMASIDLTLSDDERDQGQAKRVVSDSDKKTGAVKAAGQASTGAQQQPSAPLPAPQQADPSTATAAPLSADDMARRRIMQQAAQANTGSGNALLAQLHAERAARAAARGAGQPSASEAGAGAADASSSGRAAAPARTAGGVAAAGGAPPTISLLTYNVWFDEGVALEERMGAIGAIIAQKGFPTIVCLQEVTQNIYSLMSSAPWWRRYTASPRLEQNYFTALLFRRDAVGSAQPFLLRTFPNSGMGRGLQLVRVTVGGVGLLAATTHLESPLGHSDMQSTPRVAQCKQALVALEGSGERNVVFAGDLNWNPLVDGPLPLSPGWKDAWAELRPGEVGYTYDGKANPMLGPYNRLQNRLDRVLLRSRDWVVSSIHMVGQEAIPGVTYEREYKRGNKRLPVLPSDHFGLYAVMKPSS